MIPKLLLLSRPGCHLCEEFLDEVRRDAGPVEIEVACVDDREEWKKSYGRRIPVLLDAAGAVLGEGRYSPDVKTKLKD